MPKYKELTSVEVGQELAAMIATFHAELVKKGLSKEIADRIAANIGGGADSIFDGDCAGMARAGEYVINPPYLIGRQP